MPKMGVSMSKGLITKWLREDGDNVQKGDELFEFETEKVQTVITAEDSGVLKIVAPAGSEVPVAGLAGLLLKPGEVLTEETVIAPPVAAQEMTAATVVSGIKVARTLPLEGARKVTAQRMAESIQHAPQLTLVKEADITEASKQVEKAGYSVGGKLPYLLHTFMLIKAAAKALKDNPILNSTLNQDRIEIFDSINIGIAVATDQGLVVAVLKDADKKPFNQIAAEAEQLILKAIRGKLDIDDVSDGTFTITNMGSYGISIFTPIINPPQAAILGVGQPEDRPAVLEGKIVVRRILPLSLTFDHRITDGVPAAKFLQSVVNHFNSPDIID